MDLVVEVAPRTITARPLGLRVAAIGRLVALRNVGSRNANSVPATISIFVERIHGRI